mmetsp:Transcript_45010/g.137466  ORF Transcript_45010/g.137466 Transcript_45010/m.137466 type:complete len:277 (+) Transcript_45010:122-952(+)
MSTSQFSCHHDCCLRVQCQATGQHFALPICQCHEEHELILKPFVDTTPISQCTDKLQRRILPCLLCPDFWPTQGRSCEKASRAGACYEDKATTGPNSRGLVDHLYHGSKRAGHCIIPCLAPEHLNSSIGHLLRHQPTYLPCVERAYPNVAHPSLLYQPDWLQLLRRGRYPRTHDPSTSRKVTPPFNVHVDVWQAKTIGDHGKENFGKIIDLRRHVSVSATTQLQFNQPGQRRLRSEECARKRRLQEQADRPSCPCVADDSRRIALLLRFDRHGCII